MLLNIPTLHHYSVHSSGQPGGGGSLYPLSIFPNAFMEKSIHAIAPQLHSCNLLHTT